MEDKGWECETFSLYLTPQIDQVLTVDTLNFGRNHWLLCHMALQPAGSANRKKAPIDLFLAISP